MDNMENKKFKVVMDDYNTMFNKKYTIDTIVSYCFEYGKDNNHTNNCNMRYVQRIKSV